MKPRIQPYCIGGEPGFIARHGAITAAISASVMWRAADKPEFWRYSCDLFNDGLLPERAGKVLWFEQDINRDWRIRAVDEMPPEFVGIASMLLSEGPSE